MSYRQSNTEPVRGKHAQHAAPSAGRSSSQRARTSRSSRAPQSQASHSSRTARSHVPHSSRVSQPQPSRTSRASKPEKKRRIPRPLKIVLIVVLVAVIGVGAFFAWNTFLRYDDAQDIQGQWKIEGSTNSIVITDSEIRLTDSVSFNYELNTFEKTITYTFASYTGEGSYEFSSDRETLTLIDLNTDEPGTSEGGDTSSSMRLLKISNQALGEPESATNNDTSNAQSIGADVVDGSISAQQAERDDSSSGN